MILILEGADQAGKTSLAKAIQKHDPSFKYCHMGPNDGPIALDALHSALRDQTHIIFDRLWISELVYGWLMRDQPCFSGFQHLAMCANFGVRTIMCVPGNRLNQVRRITEAKRDEYARAVANQAVDVYWDIWHGSTKPNAEAPELIRFFSAGLSLSMVRGYYRYNSDEYEPEEWVQQAEAGGLFKKGQKNVIGY